MGQALSIAVREQIYDLQKSGQTATMISKSMGLPFGTIKQLCRRFRQLGEAGICPSYHNCGKQLSQRLADQKSEFLSLKREHPSWGAPRLRVEKQLLSEHQNVCEQDATPLASVRSINRWYRQAGLSKPRKQTNEPRIGRSKAPHNIWEVDAKERLTLADGSPACYMTVSDEHTGAWLEAVVFPLSSDQPGSH